MSEFAPRIEKAPRWLWETVLIAYTRRLYTSVLVDGVWYMEDEAPEHDIVDVRKTNFMKELYKQCSRSATLYIDHSNQTLLWDMSAIGGMSTPFMMEVEFYVPYEVLVTAEHDLEFRETVVDILLEG